MRIKYWVVCYASHGMDNWQISLFGPSSYCVKADNIGVGCKDRIYDKPMTSEQRNYWEKSTAVSQWKIIEVEYDNETGDVS